MSIEESNLHDAINGLVADIVAKKYLTTNDLPAKIKELANHTDSSENETSPVAWPTYGFKNLSLKLAVEQGTPVYAMRDGLIYYVATGS